MLVRDATVVVLDPDHLVLDIADATLHPGQEHVHVHLHDPHVPNLPPTFHVPLQSPSSAILSLDNLHHLHLNPVLSLLQLHVSLLPLRYTLNPGSHGGIGTLRNLRRGTTPTTLMRTGVIGDLRMTLRNLPPHRLLHLLLLTIQDRMNFPCLISRVPKTTTGLLW